ncbi:MULTISPECIES: DUF1697 domain-containing protein [unclassified Duganella]|uniref:DUF1697 domain-containing protein n=1 Tax=unclassified Duganella TaxID=2636909 RepID=UPI0007021F89|nr:MULTISPECIES: DUF1697 domain-containing protein [unclassified Duganella]KQV53822.1 hypothetical protein ASD07_04510 [Duganella sp. Root336D2]KRB83624.1 hypothetical protein ASE26_10665 [Duganella sp. Root198D2]
MDKQRLIALLRGINVGRAKRVAMADLRKVLSDMGYSDVRTLLNSGNVVFDCDTADAADSALHIEEALVLKLGVPAKVTVIEAAQLAEIVKENSLQHVADDHSRLLVAVLNKPEEDRSKLEPLARQRWQPEAFALGRHAAYIWCPDGVLASRAAAAMGKALGDAVTSRNWSTISKLHAMANN